MYYKSKQSSHLCFCNGLLQTSLCVLIWKISLNIVSIQRFQSVSNICSRQNHHKDDEGVLIKRSLNFFKQNHWVAQIMRKLSFLGELFLAKTSYSSNSLQGTQEVFETSPQSSETNFDSFHPMHFISLRSLTVPCVSCLTSTILYSRWFLIIVYAEKLAIH